MRRIGLVLWPTAAAVGLGSAVAGYGVGRWALWLPDLAVGLAWVALAQASFPAGRGSSSRRPALIAGAVAATWWLAGFVPLAVFWHRGPLVHLLVRLVAAPGSRSARVVISAGYLAAAFPGAWGDDVVSLALTAALAASVPLLRSADAPGERRRASTLLLVCCLALAVGAFGRLLVGNAAALPSLLVYQATLVGIALALGLSAAERRRGLADRVVELSDTGAGSFRDALADVLGDPGLQVGFWRPAAAAYLDREGGPVSPRPGRTAVVVGGTTGPVALVVLGDGRALDDETRRAVTATARLTAEHVGLEAEVAERLRQVEASRRRLLTAGDAEGALVARRLADGPELRLRRLLDGLTTAGPASPALTAATDELRAAADELRLLANGLHPSELDRGLQTAVEALAGRAGLPVTTSVAGADLPPELAAAAYFTCAEGLANAVKHARAGWAWVTVSADADGVRVEVRDDGCGGATASTSGGLAGLADRWEALGGTLAVTSPPGGGTQILATASVLAGSSAVTRS